MMKERIVSIEEQAQGFAILVNGKPIRTPQDRPLSLPSRELAESIVQEWRTQGPTIKPSSMKMLQMAATVIDIITPNLAVYRGELLNYGETDLLCYRSDTDHDLAHRQMRSWQPLLDWLNITHDIDLRTTKGVIAIEQPALAILMRLLESFDPWMLGFLGVATPLLGSLVLALAVLEERISPEEAHELAHLDSSYQEEQWGQDHEEITRRGHLKRDLFAAWQFLQLLPNRSGTKGQAAR